MAWLGTWAKRFKLTIDSSLIDADLTNFPVMLRLDSSSGTGAADLTEIFDDLGSSSLKIAVTTSDGTTQCYVEVALWDNVSEIATLYVKVPSVASGSDTDLYLYFDPSQANNSTYVGTVNSTPAMEVWDSDFLAVYHLCETASGASSIKDSTKQLMHGSPLATAPDLVSALADKGLDFEKDNSDGANLPREEYLKDNSSSAHAITVSGVLVHPVTKKYGSGAGYFNGSSAYAYAADSADWILGGGTGDFTLEAWINVTTLPSAGSLRTICGQRQGSNDQWVFGVLNNAGVYSLTYYNQTGGSVTLRIDATWTPSVATWYHVAITRSGNDFKAWVDGTQVGSTVTDSDSTTNFAANLEIGRFGAGHYFIGYIDDLRISNSARYTSAFTPPAAALVSDANTKLLVDFDQRTASIKGHTLFTLETLFQIESYTPSSGEARALYYESTETTYNTRVALRPKYFGASDTRFVAQVRDSAAGTLWEVESASLSLATWYSAAAVLDTDDDLWTLFMNGAQVDQDTASKGPPTFALAADPICLGYYNYSTKYYFDGIIDEFRLSRTDRSAAWIKATDRTLRDTLLEYDVLELLPTTAPPTTVGPTTLAPTTLAPTTLAPTTLAPTTLLPTTLAPSIGVLIGGKLVNESILSGRLVQ